VPSGCFDREELRRRGKRGASKGGKRVATLAQIICPLCGSVAERRTRRRLGMSNHFDQIGCEGGKATVARYGVEHMRRIARLGGRGNTREKRLQADNENARAVSAQSDSGPVG